MKVLDHGYVELIEPWGGGKYGQQHYDESECEAGIIEAARQSTQGSFRGWEQDEKLLKYLMDHKHNTPFEFAGMVIEVQAPIFVFREWHRHRTQSYNEMSARYAALPDLYYLPTADRVQMGGGSNKQAGSITGTEPVTALAANAWLNAWDTFYAQAESMYKGALAQGVPKELARIVMPVGHYSRMRAAANLRNWLAFLTLRLDPAAQWEIRQYANAVGQCIKGCFPHTWELFNADKTPT